MSENPYASPKTVIQAIGVVGGSRESLRSIAKTQKGILECILIYFLIYLLAGVGQAVLPPELGLVLAFGVLVVIIVGAVFVFRLAIKSERGSSPSRIGFPLHRALVLCAILRTASVSWRRWGHHRSLSRASTGADGPRLIRPSSL